MHEPRTATTRVGELRLHSVEWGDSAAPVMLYLHGTTGTGWDIERLAQSLADRYRVIGLDMRGHGESDHAPDAEGYLPDSYIDETIGFCEALGIRPVIMGSSLGASIGLGAADKRPDLVAGLIMDDDPPAIPARHLERILRKSLDIGHPSFADMAAVRAWYDRFRLGPPFNWQYTDEQLARSMQRAVMQLPDGTFTWRWDLNIIGGLVLAIDRDLGDLWDAYRDLSVPLLALQATEGKTCLAEDWERMQSLNPRAKHVQFAGAGHPTVKTREPEVLALVEEFLASAPVRARLAGR